jgi:hypothetical protein
MQTKIKLNISSLALKMADSVSIYIYDEPRKVIFTKDYTDLSVEGDRFTLEIDADFPAMDSVFYIVWGRIGGKWEAVRDGKPTVYASNVGDLILEISDISAPVIRKKREITQTDADFVNGLFQDNVVSPMKLADAQRASMATQQTVESRLSICRSCEFWDSSGFGGSGKCSKCGCSTHAKLRLAASICPLDTPKWSAQ